MKKTNFVCKESLFQENQAGKIAGKLWAPCCNMNLWPQQRADALALRLYSSETIIRNEEVKNEIRQIKNQGVGGQCSANAVK